MSRIQLVGLAIYPVKSCGGITLTEVVIGPRGPVWDRNWMWVDSNSRFLTQRQHPKMAVIKTAINETHLILTARDRPALKIPLRVESQTESEVNVWENSCRALDEGDPAARWFHSILGFEARLVRMHPDFERKVNPKYGIPEAHTGFADSLPFLLTSLASLGDLNSRLDHPVPMNRFRPNLIIEGAPAFEEDKWKRARIGEIELEFPRDCARCSITRVDQNTGTMNKEPLKTLSTYRAVGRKVLFGQNLIHLTMGTLRVGDELEILGLK
jgi:uncharacterized protein YcbX